ncbi:MAG TPA: DUF1559 domain-containing protein [Pirellulales bacterium]|nr:DUF1559 domain-containing protein [Pirellulales bacterium]
MAKSIFLALLIGFVLIHRSAPAADSAQPSLAPIAPFIGDQTVLIGRFDLAQLDINRTVKQWLTPFVVDDMQRQILSVVVEQFDSWSNRLKADGVNQFYVVSTIGHIPGTQMITRWQQNFLAMLLANTTYAVIPGASAASIQQLHEAIQAKAKQVWPNVDAKILPDCRQIHGAAVVGMGTLLDELQNDKPSSRPEFETALAAAGNKPICAAAVPPPIFARAAEEILRLPVAGTNQPAGPIIAKGFHWLAVGEEPNLEKFNLQLVIQSASPDAAQALASAIKSEIAAAVKQSNSEGTSLAALGAAQLLSLLPEAKGDQLRLTIDTQQNKLLRGLAQTALTQATAVAFQRESQNHLKAIGLSIFNEYDKLHHYPDRAIRDKDGKPLLSWRVAILPEIEETELYKQFHLDEPWDSEHNRQLIDRMPEAYRSPDTASQHPGRTRYLVPVGENTIFPPNGTVNLKDVTDGTSKTIMVVEADPEHAVVWTKPDDLEVDLENSRRGLFNGKLPCNACWADGSVRSIRNDVDAKVLGALFTRNGGEVINESSYR